jgi:hypothetical protein
MTTHHNSLTCPKHKQPHECIVHMHVPGRMQLPPTPTTPTPPTPYPPTHTSCWPPSPPPQPPLAGARRDLATVDGGLELQQVARAKDGTRKLVFKLTCGEGAGGTVETVLIPVVREQGKKPRITVCVSSQVGCAMNCQFCYTGRMGLMGNLSTAQIVEQVSD